MTISEISDIIITETKTTARQPTGQEVKHEKLSSTLRLQKHDHQHQQKRSETPAEPRRRQRASNGYARQPDMRRTQSRGRQAIQLHD